MRTCYVEDNTSHLRAMSPNRTIEVPVLTRVEGEGALDLRLRDDAIESLQLRIFEPPRLFEKLLEGRPWSDVIDTVARICGICPVAYQMSAVQALEGIFGVEVDPAIRALRRLMYCGEWIESHALHIHLLAAPDFLGFDSVTAMAERYPDEVRRGLRLQGLGNRLLALLGGRSVHPVSVCVGGFTRLPPKAELDALLEDFRAALPEAEALVAWTASLDLPDMTQDFPSVALRTDDAYPIEDGRIVSSEGLDIPREAFADHFTETQVPYSNALHCHLHGAPYLVGPLARLNLNHDRLPEAVAQSLAATGIRFPSRNPFHSIVARAVEIFFALHEAVRILESWQAPAAARADFSVRGGIGYGCTEAPRGILWHRYELADDGTVRAATITPPTSQNQARIEQDLHLALPRFGLQRPDDELRAFAEQVIRNYDPCISCATHFLRLKVDRAS